MEFRILGPLEVADGDDVIPLASAKQRALLAILLLSANEVVSADRLIDELWGEQPPESGRTALQVLVSKLRKALGDAGALLTTRPPGYLIRVEREQLDLYRFEGLVSGADGADPAVAAGRLREALALWRGPALADLAYESFAQPAIGRLEELRVAALEKRIEADLAVGRHADLVAELEGLVAEHPLREGLGAQLMVAQYRCGRQADALAAYQAARRTLIDELGIEPSPLLRELEQAILRQDPSLELARAAGAERSLLVLPLREGALGALLALAGPLARQPAREVVLARLLDDGRGLPAATAALHEERGRLPPTGSPRAPRPSRRRIPATTRSGWRVSSTATCCSSTRQWSSSAARSFRRFWRALRATSRRSSAASPKRDRCSCRSSAHDWTAIELGAWLAGAWNVPLRLAGPSVEGRDSSRLLASASLAVQRALGVAAEPLLLAPGPDELVRASQDAALIVAGLSDRWQKEGLGPARGALAQTATTPTLLVRRGMRPGGLAPPESLTRFTWSIRAGSA